MQWKKGFTMVELLVVLIILAILVAVAAPMYFANVKRARMSEAVAGIGTIRQAMRDYMVSHTTPYAVTAGNTTTAGIAATPTTGVDVNVGVTQYFSNGAYSVVLVANDPAPAFAAPTAVGFVVIADGTTGNVDCAGQAAGVSCGTLSADVAGYRAKMDNSGRILVCYGTCGTATNWQAY
jgi:prepilin-type N-terminal cleavage/methylation domain-containing protein